MSGGLAGVGVLVTRPAARAEPQVRLIEARGGHVERLPLQAIEGCAPPPGWTGPADAQVAIFTSANAVVHARDWGVHPAAGITLLASGQATAAALAQAGFGDAAVPVDADGAEGLLALPLLRAAPRVLVVTGTRPRALLVETLRARGTRVQVLEVYRRVGVGHSPARVRGALERVEAAILTSGEALGRLCALTPEESRARLMRLQLVVPSERVAREASRLGFLRAALAPRHVGDEALVDCLGAWRRNLVASGS